jgi:hypothetical protein
LNNKKAVEILRAVKPFQMVMEDYGNGKLRTAIAVLDVILDETDYETRSDKETLEACHRLLADYVPKAEELQKKIIIATGSYSKEQLEASTNIALELGAIYYKISRAEENKKYYAGDLPQREEARKTLLELLDRLVAEYKVDNSSFDKTQLKTYKGLVTVNRKGEAMIDNTGKIVSWPTCNVRIH